MLSEKYHLEITIIIIIIVLIGNMADDKYAFLVVSDG